ncbi:hypothetical protein B0H34DRAFT_799400 [Crassisporium funariophilum]|nr:hypothetical protein B0H34DRAFT_799400 [Crassisporium funariophilum]
MAQSRPSRAPHPSAKLNSENIASHQLPSHQTAIANAQQKEKFSKNSPSGTAPKDNITSTSSGGDASDHECGSTSDTTIPSQKRPIIHSDDDNDDNDDHPTSPASTQQSEEPCPKKKKKKSKKRTSTSNNDVPSASVQSIDDVSNTEEAPKLNKTQPTADVDHFFKRAV